MLVPVTALYAALLAVLYVALSLKIAFFRKNQRVDLGDGGDKHAARLIRAQGNASEYIPLALILMGVYELNGGSPLVLHAAGSLFFSARVLHAVGLTRQRGASFGRFVEATLTFAVLIALALANLFHLFIS